MFILNNVFCFPIFSIFKFAPKTPEKIPNMWKKLGNKSDSDSDSKQYYLRFNVIIGYSVAVSLEGKTVLIQLLLSK